MEFMASHSFASYAVTTDSRLNTARKLLDYIHWYVPSVAMWSFLRRRHRFWMTTQCDFNFEVRQNMMLASNDLQRKRHFCSDSNPYAIARRGLRRSRNVCGAVSSNLSHFELESTDNGSEFIAKVVQRWLKTNQIKTIYIEPGSP